MRKTRLVISVANLTVHAVIVCLIVLGVFNEVPSDNLGIRLAVITPFLMAFVAPSLVLLFIRRKYWKPENAEYLLSIIASAILCMICALVVLYILFEDGVGILLFASLLFLIVIEGALVWFTAIRAPKQKI